ncbi:MAG: type II secretion system F family protein [Actinomycetota bacterium]|nr:type II secretion system F family protein [Actinomycetota bacterium]
MKNAEWSKNAIYARDSPSRRGRELGGRADALRALAGCIRSGETLGEALASWHRNVPPPGSIPLRKLANEIVLGRRPLEALAAARPVLGADLDAVAVAVSIHMRTGADLALMVDRIAQRLDEKQERWGAARASSAAAGLSSKVVAALPLFFIPLMPGRPAATAPGATIATLLGILLAAAGLVWVRRLTPAPPGTDPPAAVVADVVAIGLRAGAGASLILEALAGAPGADPSLRRAERSARLGQPWPRALAAVDPDGRAGFRDLGVVLQRSEALGLPASTALDRFSATLRTRDALEFDRKVKRAPVLMVVPLALCILPGAGLVALGPFIGGLLGS